MWLSRIRLCLSGHLCWGCRWRNDVAGGLDSATPWGGVGSRVMTQDCGQVVALVCHCQNFGLGEPWDPMVTDAGLGEGCLDK